MKILVLDDHKEFGEEILGMLARNGHEGDRVERAVDAIPLAENGKYDFVLVDFDMPEHNGLWFMQHVKLPRRTKALLVTGHDSTEIINRMFQSGSSGYIIKPFDEEDLMRHLRHHTHRF